jgi:hypothetical protein
VPSTPRFRAVLGTINALSKLEELPDLGDRETSFSPGRAFVRRVEGYRLWVLYRCDNEHLFVMTARDEPPTRVDD